MKTAPPIVEPWYSRSPDALAKEFHTSVDGGLSAQEAQQRLQREGSNELPEAPPPSLVKLFFSQFTSVIVWVLIGADVISGLLEDWLDAAAILAIVLLNGLLGFSVLLAGHSTPIAIGHVGIYPPIIIGFMELPCSQCSAMSVARWLRLLK